MKLKYFLGKIIGLVAGFLVGNWLGALLGFGVGVVVDRLHREGLLLWDAGPKAGETDITDFMLSSLVLAAAVVKSDGDIEELELSYIQSFLAEQFGAERVSDYMEVLETALKQEWELREVTLKIRQSTSYETRLQILYFLFGIANADYNIDEREIATIKIISIHLNIQTDDYHSIKAMFYGEMDAHYQILEIPPSCSDEEVRVAYRLMAKKYHPDKIAHLGDAVQHAAEEKFLKVQQAFEMIKEKRGFS